jgi:Holliday junction resolvasome RuvABC ATP-dependent DNA helicase subunit
MRDTTFYVAQKVSPVITELTTEILIRHFVKIEVHEHVGRGQDDTLFVPHRPNSSAMFTGRKDVLEKLKDHFAPADWDNKHRKSFLLYGMGGIGKTQICLKFVEEVADR